MTKSKKIGSLTRAIAIDALMMILVRHMHSDTALDKLFLQYPDLRPLDKAFIYEMVLGSLRWLSKMDWIMSNMLDRPFHSLDPRVANALRVGCYQIYYMDKVPARAAVSETVEAIRDAGVPNAASLVNAVLRRVARKSEYFPKPDKETQTADYYAMHCAHPKWMVERWLKHIPREKFEYLMSHNNKQPKATLRIMQKKLPLIEGGDLRTYFLKNQSLESSYCPLPYALHVERYPKFETCEAYAQGCYIVQDESAQLISQLVAPLSSHRVLDACAAPGGKSIHLLDAFDILPQNMTVCDNSKKRLKILNSNFARLGIEGVEVLSGDVMEQCRGREFDKVLLDAPCSAVGTIRRHPEIKWNLAPTDIDHCAQTQSRLLDGIASLVAVGGELIYAVCSFEQEETSQQIDKFLERHPCFERVSLSSRVHDYYKKYITKKNELLIYGGNADDMDGFYGVVLKKKSISV